MELKTGYKQTEIGVIPSDWILKRMSECCSKITDGTHDTPKPTETGVPFLTAIHVKENSIDFDSCYYLPEEVHKIIYGRCNPEKNDVLMVNIGAGVATTALVNVEYEFSLKNVALLKPNGKLLLGSYLNYYQEFVKGNIVASLSTGGAQPFLSLSQIGSLEIALPTIAEQTAIATVLSDTDQYITHLEKLIAKKRNIKQGAMQELLKPKEGWVVKKLGLIGKTFGGLSGKTKADFQGGIYPYIPFMNIMNNPAIDTTYFDYVNIGASENQNKAQKGDLFFNGSSETPEEVGMCSVLLEDISNLYLNSFCFGFRLFNEQEVNGIYLSYFFRSGEGRKLIFSLAQGATRYNLSKANFLKLVMPMPEVDEQTHIATILSDMDSEIITLETKLCKARSIKQGMMQQLLTGKIRLI
jgi:type I restriction enzyme S subunit